MSDQLPSVSSRPGSAELLRALRSVMAGYVEAGEVPGAVLAVSSGADNLVEATGRTGPGGDQLSGDAIVRISSMTKPIVAAVTHRLAEDGLLALTDPITRWMPELAERRVVRRLDGPVDDTVPADREITVEDLLTMRMGFGFAFEVESCPVAELAVARGLGMGAPLPGAVPHEPDEWIRQFAQLPLMEQPGSQWRYEFAYPVLGVLLARAAGKSLPAVVSERLLEPLGMTDTGFVVPERARDRLIPCFTAGDDGLVMFDDAVGSDWLRPFPFPHGGGGLVSTAADYLRFGRLLLDGGVHDGARLLSTQAVAEIITDQLTADQHSGPSAGTFLDGGGWGHGLQVRLGEDRPRRYGWGGGLGTTWYNFPDHDLTVVLLTQHVPPLASANLRFWSALDEQLHN